MNHLEQAQSGKNTDGFDFEARLRLTIANRRKKPGNQKACESMVSKNPGNQKACESTVSKKPGNQTACESTVSDTFGTSDLVGRLQQMIASEQGDGHPDDMLSDDDTQEPETTNVPMPEVVMTKPKPVLKVPNSADVSNKSERVKKRNLQQSKNNRKRARIKAQALGHPPEIREKARAKHVGKVDPISTTMMMADVRVTRGGYTAMDLPKNNNNTAMDLPKNKKKDHGGKETEQTEVPKKAEYTAVPQKTVYSTKELKEMGFEYKVWDGKTPIPVGGGDEERPLMAIPAGHPDPWDTINKACMAELDKARETLHGSKDAPSDRRGSFFTLCTGVSYGGGQTKPMNFGNKGVKGDVVDHLNQQSCFQRIAGLQSSVFGTWAPKLYSYYHERLGMLLARDPSLKKPFRSIFPAATYNLGPRTVCVPHVDFANLPFGYCAITALGDYNPKTGGHLVLWECKLIIEFPPGATILIPSAIVTHFNIPVSKTEMRYSFTQYAAGGLFRWVDNNFMTSAKHLATLTDEQLEAKCEADENRWSYGLSLLPTV